MFGSGFECLERFHDATTSLTSMMAPRIPSNSLNRASGTTARNKRYYRASGTTARNKRYYRCNGTTARNKRYYRLSRVSTIIAFVQLRLPDHCNLQLPPIFHKFVNAKDHALLRSPSSSSTRPIAIFPASSISIDPRQRHRAFLRLHQLPHRPQNNLSGTTAACWRGTTVRAALPPGRKRHYRSSSYFWPPSPSFANFVQF